MADAPIVFPRLARGVMIREFEDYSAAALTTGTNKRIWICSFYGRIISVMCNSEGANGGTTDDIIDVNKNGTTIFGTQANRPTLTADDTGMFTIGKHSVTLFEPGDILSYDVDQIGATGSTLFSIAIVTVAR